MTHVALMLQQKRNVIVMENAMAIAVAVVIAIVAKNLKANSTFI